MENDADAGPQGIGNEHRIWVIANHEVGDIYYDASHGRPKACRRSALAGGVNDIDAWRGR